MRERERLFLVDGFALAYRAFFALIGRPLRTTRGENTSVPWGVTRFLRKILAEQEPEYLAVVFDAPGGSFRRALYPDYKATRDKLDQTDAGEFSRSLARVRQILEALRIASIEVEGYEADDVIAALAAQATARGIETVIVSGDTDFYQLIGPGVSVYEPGRGGRSFIEAMQVDAAAAAERLGVPADKVIDYLALVGDRSDNVPGVRGVGPKTASDLLARFGSLDAILEHSDEIEPRRRRELIRGQAESARLSRDLVTLRTDAPVTLDLEALRVQAPDRDRVRDLFVELEFHTLLHEMAPEPVRAPRWRIPAADELAQLASVIRRRGRAALELCAGDSLERGPPLGLAIAIEPGRALYLPLGHRRGTNLPPLDSEPMTPLAAALESPEVMKIGHDLKRALLSLRAAGVALAGPLTDTSVAAYCLDPTRRQYELEPLVVERFGHGLREPEVSGEPAASDPAELAPRATERADAALRLADRLRAELDHYGQRRLFEEIEMPLIPVLADMEEAGIAVDREVLRALGRRLDRGIEQARARIRENAGSELNPDSPTQLRQVLFGRLRLPVLKRTKTGPSTDAEVLAELAAAGHPLPMLILEYRELSKLASTYVAGLTELCDPETGRLHTSFNQTATATGRLSSSEPNLQNIPVRTELGATIRSAFVPGPGCLLLEADYSQIELRILAHLSRDPAFLEAFRAGRDVHRETAARVFGVTQSEVTGPMRETAKMVNYATIYGQGAPSLARRLGIGIDRARRFIDDYFQRFPAIRDYLDAAIARARADGYVETLLGRRRYVPELRSPNPRIRGFGRRVAQNTPIQGSAADVIKLAMIRIHERLARRRRGVRMLIQVHDELLFEVPVEAVEETRALVRTEMEQVFDLEVPLVALCGAGKSWLEAKQSPLDV